MKSTLYYSNFYIFHYILSTLLICMSHVISNGDSAILTGQFILIHCLEKLCLFQVKANELL